MSFLRDLVVRASGLRVAAAPVPVRRATSLLRPEDSNPGTDEDPLSPGSAGAQEEIALAPSAHARPPRERRTPEASARPEPPPLAVPTASVQTTQRADPGMRELEDPGRSLAALSALRGAALPNELSPVHPAREVSSLHAEPISAPLAARVEPAIEVPEEVVGAPAREEAPRSVEDAVRVSRVEEPVATLRATSFAVARPAAESRGEFERSDESWSRSVESEPDLPAETRSIPRSDGGDVHTSALPAQAEPGSLRVVIESVEVHEAADEAAVAPAMPSTSRLPSDFANYASLRGHRPGYRG